LIDAGEESSPWFQLRGNRVLQFDSLVISKTKVIASVLFRTAQKADGKEYFKKSFLFDRDAKTYAVLPQDDIGPMAMSWDGKRMIRFEFSFFGLSARATVC
jgi:hypothetical protein